MEIINGSAISIPDALWKDVRLEISSGNITYVGRNKGHKIATSSSSWYVWKYTWSANDLVRTEGPILGAWDDRATLGWG